MSNSRSRSRSGCVGGQIRQLADHVGVAPEREPRLEAPLQRAQPQLLEARDRTLSKRLGCQVGQRVPRQSARASSSAATASEGSAASARAHSASKRRRSSASGSDVDDVTGRPGLDRRLAERAPQLGDLAMHLRHRGRGGVAGVELVGDAVDRHHPTGLEQQQREDRALGAPAERDLLAVAMRLERAEDAERDHGGTVAAR